MAELQEIKQMLELLAIKHKFQINYAMYGDTYGIYEDYLYISVKKSNYYFKLKLDQ